jgi:DNA (cytosine-5)-methyltransferase 1
MKILNLYSGLGGNRRLWGDEHSITSIELNEEVAIAYKENFPNDKVIIADAHQYLLNNYKDYDFIWSSPPCQSHSRIRQYLLVKSNQKQAIYPDMSLYQEIILLRENAKCKWVVENVKPYYEPLFAPSVEIGRHCFWSNFHIPAVKYENSVKIEFSKIKEFESNYNISAKTVKINKIQALRNCVDPEIGLYILNTVLRLKHQYKQLIPELFN